MKRKKDYSLYLQPEIKVISINSISVLCASGGSLNPVPSGGGINDMNRADGKDGDDVLGD